MTHHDRHPAGYPRDLERRFPLADGRSVFVRPVVPDDAARIAAALANADHDTVYQRFFRAPVRLDDESLRRLTHLDYHDRMALVAFDDGTEGPEPGAGVAIARYEALGDGAAEVAVVVDPAWRRMGLGEILLDGLEDAAFNRGLHRFVAIHLPENRAIASLLRRSGFAHAASEAGFLTVAKDLLPAA